MRKRPLHITAVRNGKRADVRIVGMIDSYSKANAQDFERQVDDLVRSGVRDAHVFIDSEGGSVLEANRIANTIARFSGTITGEGGVLVASAATYIALKLSRFDMPRNGMYMIHKPSAVFAGDEDTLGKDLEALKKHTAEYKKAYAAKTGKTEEEVESLWAKGDKWFTAAEAAAEKFIDGVLQDDAEVNEEAVSSIAACGCPANMLPKAAAAATTKDQMDIKALRVQLGMPETATEQEVLAKVKQLQDNANAAATAAANARAAEVKALIDKAITDKRITEAHRKGFEAKFSADFDATKAELEAITPVVSMAAAAAPAAGAAEVATKGREAWDYDKWATQDMKGLTALMRSEKQEDKDKFIALYEAKYGRKPVLK